MTFAVAARLYRQILPRLPVVVALAFGLYSLALVAWSVDSSLHRRNDANSFLVADNVRRAASLGERIDEIIKEDAVHANLYEIRAYLMNRDLGMSPRYGLDSSLQTIEERFKEHTQHSWSTSASRISFIGTGGQRLADTEPNQAVPPLALNGTSVPRLTLDVDHNLLIGVEPVIYKGLPEGTVVTNYPADLLKRNLIAISGTNPYRELLLTADGRELSSDANSRPIDAAMLRSLVQMPQNTVLPIGAAKVPTSDTELSGMLVINTAVPGLPLQLVTLLPTDRAHGHLTSPALMVTAGLVPILLLLGALRLNRLRQATDRLQHEVATADQQRQWALQRNLELGAEIQQREMIERALKESEERWQVAIRGANDGIWDWNLQSGQVHFSDRWKTMLGYTPEEIAHDAQEWITRIHPDDRERTLAEVQRHQRGETEFYQCEHRLRCKDLSYKWILARGKALSDANGNAVRISGSHTDITQRHQADALLRDRTDQLNAIFALSPDGFVSFDAARRVKFANAAFFTLTAIDESEFIGLDEEAVALRLSQLCTEKSAFPGMSALRAASQHLQKQEAQADADDKPATGKRSGRYRIELSGPGKRILEVSLRESTADSVSQILYLRDITYETEVERLKSEFLSTAAHELRTPMSSILGFSEVMLAGDFEAEERHEFLDTIHRNSLLMANLINELLDLARIEARGGKDFHIETLQAGPLLHDIIADFKAPQLREPPLLHLPGEDLWLRGDRSKLTQAIGNILSNAYKYSPDGGTVDIEVVMANAPDGSRQLAIQVRDHGIGMTAEQQSHVCERFYRADTSGKILGTGLGMSIVKEIIELHGGSVALASSAGAGTTVTLRLPAGDNAIRTDTPNVSPASQMEPTT